MWQDSLLYGPILIAIQVSQVLYRTCPKISNFRKSDI